MKGVIVGILAACVVIVAFVAGTQFEERNDGPVENMAESLDGAAE